jgi:hypothetical protein
VKIPEICTLNVEMRDGHESGIWLCLDDGKEAIPIARFVSANAADQYKHAVNIAAMKAHAMGKSGI